MKFRILSAGALTLVMVGLAYGAASKPTINPWHYIGKMSFVDHLFEHHDADGDGEINRDEAQAFFEELAANAE
ncbi:hypothetical protein JHL21_13220 [Devosia sp. WQ 349]|uniref:hypothetical protein n=1 Tax=Devosia sp. WQ 349K1 TaxID=2800329 RepID=UPI00190744A9|nr:hypothetical protein [Devosia sp. WQ 349K1]MBK1795458.1 hypothetical protein [Devosia sp. WQ 349K1]